MVNLFSVFDPSSSLITNWTSLILVTLLLPQTFWVMGSKASSILSMVCSKLHSEFKILVNQDLTPGLTKIFIAMLLLIATNNAMGLLPYTFTATSHLAPSMAMSLPLWLGLMLYGWFNHTKHMLAHLVPQSTPPVLMPFMVVIETVSNLIRPLTLAVRLTANMIAGHLIMTLLGNQMADNSMIMSGFVLLVTQVTLLILESAVALIQSYVFTVLACLYSSEVN
uniref:F-ATPase protein 6 n=1 Tax=Megalothorax incertus TaxID=2579793 RepID=A0A8E8GTT4_9HEXA|nr:ATP synthase F0 subunit 6 [Megalothorax incertus]